MRRPDVKVPELDRDSKQLEALELDPFRFLLISLAGWLNQRRLNATESLREENRVLREYLGGKRLRLNDAQRRRLAAKAKGLGRTDLPGGRGHNRDTGEPDVLAPQVDIRSTRAVGSADRDGWGTKLPRGTIAEILARHGIEPAPERSRKTTWKELLSRHWELIVATGLFTVEVWTRRVAAVHGAVLYRAIDRQR